jgi:hypothetical protein
MAVAIVSEHRIFKKATAVAKVTKRTRYARVSLDEQNKKKKKISSLPRVCIMQNRKRTPTRKRTKAHHATKGDRHHASVKQQN